MKRNVDVLVGLCWGDCGKGKVIDAISHHYEMVVRCFGGSSAGHTIWHHDKKYVFNILPSAMLDGGVIGILGNGMVIDPIVLMKEISTLELGGCMVLHRLYLSDKAHITLPSHRLLDSIKENNRKNSGQDIIGSTCRGNTPTYSDKYNRIGLRFCDIEMMNLERTFSKAALHHFEMMAHGGVKIEDMKIDDKSYGDYYEEWIQAMQKVLSLVNITNTENYIHEYMNNNKEASILLEGANGTMLDVDFGSYPYVTSSHVTSGGACIGSGVPPTHIRDVIGVTKLYSTRVGNGFYPTEMVEEMANLVRKEGNEYGSVTARPRRCGWLDLVALKYAVKINGVTAIALTKSDIFDSYPHINICVSYLLPDGKETEVYTEGAVKPVYKMFKGWQQVIKDYRTFDEMPIEFQEVVEFIEDYIGVPVKFISTGREQNKMIFKN